MDKRCKVKYFFETEKRESNLTLYIHTNSWTIVDVGIFHPPKIPPAQEAIHHPIIFNSSVVEALFPLEEGNLLII